MNNIEFAPLSSEVIGIYLNMIVWSALIIVVCFNFQRFK